MQGEGQEAGKEPEEGKRGKGEEGKRGRGEEEKGGKTCSFGTKRGEELYLGNEVSR